VDKFTVDLAKFHSGRWWEGSGVCGRVEEASYIWTKCCWDIVHTHSGEQFADVRAIV